MIAGRAFAKVNLGLRVGSRRADGFHPISGIFQSVTMSDALALQQADRDQISTATGGEVPDGSRNLAMRAVRAVRETVFSGQPIRVTLDKGIPTAAGLGGGSADAAAALVLAGELFGVGMDTLRDLAPLLGSDVPFCLRGGTGRVTGRGENIEPLAPLDGFALAVVVPPVELSTPDVFARWDDLGEPDGLRIPAPGLPPILRAEEALINDLYPAAITLQPEVDDWRRELESRWGRPVMMSGSGPSLFGFFLDSEEATDALAVVRAGSRTADCCELSAVGWEISSRVE